MNLADIPAAVARIDLTRWHAGRLEALQNELEHSQTLFAYNQTLYHDGLYHLVGRLRQKAVRMTKQRRASRGRRLVEEEEGEEAAW